jgi:hypothetical protein
MVPPLALAIQENPTSFAGAPGEVYMAIKLRDSRLWLTFLASAAFLIASLPAGMAEAAPGSNPPPQLHAIVAPVPPIGDHPDGLVQVTLDGSGSSTSNFDPITYTWKDSGNNVIGTGPTVPVILSAIGDFNFTLKICDINHPSACATTLTTVHVVLDETPPLVDAPDLTVKATETGGARGSASPDLAAYLSGGKTSATDDVDPHPKFVDVEINGFFRAGNDTLFPLGETMVTVNYMDQAGNLGTALAKIVVTDKQDNDIFVYLPSPNDCCFNAAIYRVRNGIAEKFCQPTQYAPFPDPDLIVDSEGRVVFEGYMGHFLGYPLGLFRCNNIGDPPENLAEFKTGFFGPQVGLEPPEAFPGKIFNSVGSLHLERVRRAVIDDKVKNGTPQVVTEDAYVFAERQGNGPGVEAIRYDVDSQIWEGPGGTIPDPIQRSNGLPFMVSHGGATFSSDGGTIQRKESPLRLDVSGNVTVGGNTVSFDVSLSLFGLLQQINGGMIVADDQIPRVPSGCPNPPPPGIASTMPGILSGSGFNILSDNIGLFYDEYNGAGLIGVDNNAFGPGAVYTIHQELLDDNPFNDDVGLFQDGPAGCTIANSVRVSHLIPYFDFDQNGVEFVNDTGPIASAPNGLYTTIGRSPSQVALISPPKYAPVATLPINGQTGGLAAFPAATPAPSGVEVFIRVDSPVDVLATDPNGKSIGVLNGQPVNDFGSDGFDSGPGEPRFFAIRNPAPGNFTMQSVGTDTGPFTVHVYTVNLDKKYGQHILMSGTTSPGAIGNHNFTLGSDGGLTFTNHPPLANAGGDQTVTSTSSGGAMVTLDASASSDPDGDPLTFVWAGPFGILSGAVIAPTLPVGTSVVEVTVTDSHGASSKATATITVLPGCAADLSGSVTVTRGGYRWNSTTGRFVQTVSLTNNSSASVAGPVSLVLDSLSANAGLYGAAGSTACAPPLGSPYVAATAGALAPGATVSTTLQFTDPAKTAISYHTRVLAGAGTR